ncbi:HNH endonuclease signature motif containing protein [Orbus wheelerorum]|uniref:HNH endonuclease n=1 Tax=Orbus wheelerorum TaxID=3074111 RepID=UPI00370D53B3
MPPRIPKACRKIGCAKTTTDTTGYCAEHTKTENTWSKYQNGKSRHQRGYGTAWDKLRGRILKRDKYLCQCEECKRFHFIKPATEVDHIIPKAHGGNDSLSNLRAINKECHKRKTARERLNGRG